MYRGKKILKTLRIAQLHAYANSPPQGGHLTATNITPLYVNVSSKSWESQGQNRLKRRDAGRKRVAGWYGTWKTPSSALD